MSFRQIISYFVTFGALLLLMVSFQNCAPHPIGDSIIKSQAGGGGIEGMKYLTYGLCDDGHVRILNTIVTSNDLTSAAFVRKDCQDLTTPESIPVANLQFATNDTSVFALSGQAYDLQTSQPDQQVTLYLCQASAPAVQSRIWQQAGITSNLFGSVAKGDGSSTGALTILIPPAPSTEFQSTPGQLSQMDLMISGTHASLTYTIAGAPADSASNLNCGSQNSPPVANTWDLLSTVGAPAAADWASAVWTGTEMVVWGGCTTAQDIFEQCQGLNLNSGARYNPTSDTWTTMSSVNAPSPRHGLAMAWTGTKLLVWGGTNDSAPLQDGAQYDPVTDTWTSISTTNAPSTGIAPAYVWSGTELIVWNGGAAATGGRYNPSTDSWVTMSTASAPSDRSFSGAVWTGTEMLIWGGSGSSGDLNTGARYNPSLDQWSTMSVTGAPSARSGFTPVWTGQSMIIWGGKNNNDGALYNPATDSWTSMNLTNAPSPVGAYSGIWTGQDMIVWGGLLYSGGGVSTGARYTPSTNTWTAIANLNSPTGRYSQVGVWSGSQMIVWGGKKFGAGPLNTGGRFNP